MKKKLIGCITLGLLACTISTTAFAGTWQQEKWGDWEYIKDDGSYARNEWIYDGGSWYFIHNTTSMASDEIISGNDTSINRNGDDYFVSTSGQMVKGGFFDRDSSDKVFADKDGRLIDGLFMVDGVLYQAYSEMMDNSTNDTYVLGIHNEEYNKYDGVLNNEHSDSYYIKAQYDHGKILDRDGKPFAADSKIFTQAKYIPKYDSKGNLIGAIQNPNGYVID